MKNRDLFVLNYNNIDKKIIKKETKQKLSIFEKIRVFLYKIITGNKISANAIFRPLKTRLYELNNLSLNTSTLTNEEITNLKLRVNSHLKYLKAEEKIKIIDDLILQVDMIRTKHYVNPIYSKINKENINPPQKKDDQESISNKSTSKKQKSLQYISKEQISTGQTTQGQIYTHVTVFKELSDYKEWLNLILKDANSASLTSRKKDNLESQFQLDLNVHQFAALFYFLQQEKILIIPDGKKREFAKAITAIFYTKAQKKISVDSFINKFSKPEIDVAQDWAIKFINLRKTADKIN